MLFQGFTEVACSYIGILQISFNWFASSESSCCPNFNPFVPNACFLYSLKPYGFLIFSGKEKGNIENKWVNAPVLKVTSSCNDDISTSQISLALDTNVSHQGSFVSEMEWVPFKCLFWNTNYSNVKLIWLKVKIIYGKNIHIIYHNVANSYHAINISVNFGT